MPFLCDSVVFLYGFVNLSPCPSRLADTNCSPFASRSMCMLIYKWYVRVCVQFAVQLAPDSTYAEVSDLICTCNIYVVFLQLRCLSRVQSESHTISYVSNRRQDTQLRIASMFDKGKTPLKCTTHVMQVSASARGSDTVVSNSVRRYIATSACFRHSSSYFSSE